MRRLATLVAVGLFATACTASSEPDATNTDASTSSTVAPTTTTTSTTTLPIFVAGAAGIGDDYYTSLGNGGYDV